jgi:hypothetical protein
MRLWASAVVLTVLALFPARADAVSINDLVALSRSGVSDEILIALIDADRTVFNLNGDQILTLKGAGVSDRVVLKMLRSGREFTPPVVDPPPLPEPAVVVQEAPTRVIEVPVTVVEPVYVPYPVVVSRDHHAGSHHVPVVGQPVQQFRGDFGRFMVTGPVQQIEVARPARVTPPAMRTFPPARQIPPSIR